MMRLYLVQHGDAVAKDVDADRPLSDQGHEDIARIAETLADSGVVVRRVVHSGKTRARQTAEILAETMNAPSPEAVDGLAPNDPVEPWSEMTDAAEDWVDHTMLVGHLPLMAKLTAKLVCGDALQNVVQFRPGTVVCLEKSDGGGWSIAWMARPDMN